MRQEEEAMQVATAPGSYGESVVAIWRQGIATIDVQVGNKLLRASIQAITGTRLLVGEQGITVRYHGFEEYFPYELKTPHAQSAQVYTHPSERAELIGEIVVGLFQP